MSPSYLPLHWESTGDKWWYASPIDLAAANGYYDLVRELLHLDMNLLIKLTSLRRIQRLEALWDDGNHLVHAAKCQSIVAHNLLLECETKNNKNSLIQAGYGGWLLYTAAAAGDNGFVQELLERDPLLVFGEGEYGVTDMLYAAARSKNIEVFKSIFDRAISPRCLDGEGGGSEEALESGRDKVSFFRWEIVNRAVFAAAKGGNLEVLKELLMESLDVLDYRDNQGATILHASAGRGQVEVVKDLLETFNIIESRDNRGNTALHIAAFRGHLPVVEALISASTSLSHLKNNDGDTFFHLVVASFQMSGFRCLDRQMKLVQQLISGNIVNVQNIINIQNNNGRTALHVAVIGTLHSDLVVLLMAIPSIDINVQDINGMTPLDLLNRQVGSSTSNLLIKKFVSAGGILNSNGPSIESGMSSLLKVQSGTGNSPGSSFRIADSEEIFLYAGIEGAEASGRLLSSCSSISKSESEDHTNKKKPSSSLNAAARKLRILLRLPLHKVKKIDDDCHDSMSSVTKWSEGEEIPTPLRQTYSNGTSSLVNNKRTVAVRTSVPSPATKKKFAASLIHGVFQERPQLAPYSQPQTPVSSFPCSQVSSPLSEKQKVVYVDNEKIMKTTLNHFVYSHITKASSKKLSLINSKFMNKFFCVEANGLEIKNSSARMTLGRCVPPDG
ncbi:serine/threonine-protein phosphatase 6 regulatory ankyrin repeat subunit B-like [Dendrobium catenatum]|uniref:Ankyrin repeat-containing protein n=1 Tax=Dendrobium catenatum TaxID=906689 RepID=A0A2I0XGI2_9ASPA|nr:serine/threonine-protein phosphatase 6 regulatory ankyrin repeat subunit B-like [Dendrobium catenatum]PKU87021.1 Ankyrin repeat-containing protein [Dendrobium catenatum]